MSKAVLVSLAFPAILFFGVMTGCGPEKLDTVTVAGKVTVDGEPVETGAITFASADGQTASGGGAITNGTYQAEVPPGKKNVVISGGKVVGQEPLYQGVPDSPMRDKIVSVTPLDYNNKNTTPLQADITGKTEELNFDLDSKYKK